MKKYIVYLTTTARKVGKYTIEGELIQVFNTVREAKKDTYGVPNVLEGRRKLPEVTFGNILMIKMKIQS